MISYYQFITMLLVAVIDLGSFVRIQCHLPGLVRGSLGQCNQAWGKPPVLVGCWCAWGCAGIAFVDSAGASGACDKVLTCPACGMQGWGCWLLGALCVTRELLLWLYLLPGRVAGLSGRTPCGNDQLIDFIRVSFLTGCPAVLQLAKVQRSALRPASQPGTWC